MESGTVRLEWEEGIEIEVYIDPPDPSVGAGYDFHLEDVLVQGKSIPSDEYEETLGVTSLESVYDWVAEQIHLWSDEPYWDWDDRED